MFTDIEGSTRLWEEHPQAMKPALARHDAILHREVTAKQDYPAAQAIAEEAARVLRQTADRRLILVQAIQASALEALGNLAESERLRQEVRRQLGLANHPMFISALLGIGYEARFRGRPEEARAYFGQALAIALRLKSPHMSVVIESELAHLARLKGDIALAGEAYRGLIVRWKDLGQYSAVAHQLECLAMIASQEGQAKRAATLFGAAEALREQSQNPRRGHEIAEYQGAVAALRAKTDAAVIDSAWTIGRSLDLVRAVQYAAAPGEDPGAGNPASV